MGVIERSHRSLIGTKSQEASLYREFARRAIPATGRQRAVECEQAAQTVRDSDTRAVYADLAHHWRELARQAESLDAEALRDQNDGK